MMSRMLRKPIRIMKNRINSMLNGVEDDTSYLLEIADQLKLMIYSAHDTQVTQMMAFLTEDLDDFAYTPYASQVIFELKYSETCLKQSPSPDCFGVSMIFDGQALSVSGCSGDGFSTDGSGCSWTDFMSFMQRIWYSGPYADNLDRACKRVI